MIIESPCRDQKFELPALLPAGVSDADSNNTADTLADRHNKLNSVSEEPLRHLCDPLPAPSAPPEEEEN